MIVDGVMSGMHRSPYQGMAVEFAQHRQYVTGDDTRTSIGRSTAVPQNSTPSNISRKRTSMSSS